MPLDLDQQTGLNEEEYDAPAAEERDHRASTCHNLEEGIIKDYETVGFCSNSDLHLMSNSAWYYCGDAAILGERKATSSSCSFKSTASFFGIIIGVAYKILRQKTLFLNM